MIFVKKFTHVLPDEPNKQTTKKNLAVECEYQGQQYLLARVVEQTGTIVYVERGGDSQEFLESFIREEQGFQFIIIDANVNTWEAAYLTGHYTHGEVADYTEVLPTGETYVYQWADGGGIITQSHNINQLKFVAGTNSFVRPAYATLPITPQSFQELIKNHTSDMEKIQHDTSRFTSEQLANVATYLNWLNTAGDRYKGVDPWKIPFPVYPNLG